MPKPDQNVSSSAALQRPQRQKALPKPVAKNIDTETVTEEVIELQGAQVSFEMPSDVPELVVESSLDPEFTEPKKKVITVGIGAPDEKTKPILKPQLKPKLKPVIELAPDQSDLEHSEPELKASVQDVIDPENLAQELEKVIDQEVENLDIPTQEITKVEDIVINHEPESQELEIVEVSDEISDEIIDGGRSPDLAESNELSLESNQDQVQDQTIESPLPIFWCQAVGLLAGKYIPSAEAFHKGELTTDAGFTYKAYVLSKAVKSLEKKIDLSQTHHFVVYPKTSKLHGVRFEILATDVSSKIEEFEDGQFNIRGLVTKHLEDAVLVEIQRRPEYLHPAQYDRFSLEVRGNIPSELMQQFIYLKCQLTENYLSLLSYEHLACPINPKLTKTEKPILKPKVSKIEPDQSPEE